MELLASPFQPAFDEFVQTARSSCVVCSPFITRRPIDALIASVKKRGLEATLRVHVMTDLSARHLMEGVTDVAALCALQDALRHVTVTYLPRLHAKVYLAEDSFAVVTSANFTDGGAWANFEYGIRTRTPEAVAQIRRDMETYAALGSPVSPAKLAGLAERVRPLREAVRDEKRALTHSLRDATRELRNLLRDDQNLQKLTQETEDDLFRIRVDKRSLHAIFSETVLFVLAKGPFTTADLHQQIQQIHPDLCDDTIDRVIDGVSFGKKWKHHVRGAQVGLRRANLIALDPTTHLWQRTSQ